MNLVSRIFRNQFEKMSLQKIMIFTTIQKRKIFISWGIFGAAFRIRIRSDPYHLVGSGSGSVSGNVDMDPGSAKNLPKPWNK